MFNITLPYINAPRRVVALNLSSHTESAETSYHLPTNSYEYIRYASFLQRNADTKELHAYFRRSEIEFGSF